MEKEGKKDKMRYVIKEENVEINRKEGQERKLEVWKDEERECGT